MGTKTQGNAGGILIVQEDGTLLVQEGDRVMPLREYSAEQRTKYGKTNKKAKEITIEDAMTLEEFAHELLWIATKGCANGEDQEKLKDAGVFCIQLLGTALMWGRDVEDDREKGHMNYLNSLDLDELKERLHEAKRWHQGFVDKGEQPPQRAVDNLRRCQEAISKRKAA
jgi:hypothetical protein